MSDEKANLEEKLNQIIDAVNEKAKNEVESVKSRFAVRIESLSTELHTVKLVSTAFMSLKIKSS